MATEATERGQCFICGDTTVGLPPDGSGAHDRCRKAYGEGLADGANSDPRCVACGCKSTGHGDDDGEGITCPHHCTGYYEVVRPAAPGDEGEAVERVRAWLAEGEGERVPGQSAAVLLKSDLRSLLAAVERLAAERDGWERRAFERFEAAFSPEASAEVQWGLQNAGGHAWPVFGSADNEAVARCVAAREDLTAVCRVIGAWKPAPPSGGTGEREHREQQEFETREALQAAWDASATGDSLFGGTGEAGRG